MAILGKVVGGVGLGLVALVGYGLYLEWDVERWDRKIDALCAADGGRGVALRLYETAVAPETKEYFAGSGSNRSFALPWRRNGKSLGPNYPFVQEFEVVETLSQGNPTVVKFVERIVRVQGNKILAERYGYQRAGGGIPGPDPSTNHNCPSIGLQNDLHYQVFLNHPLKAQGGGK
ncbi:MAG: hypothetical protein U1F00_08190 [Rhodoferax sp.]